MALHQDTNTNYKLFTEYGGGFVAVNGKRFQQPVVVMAAEVRTDWTATDFASLNAAHFDYFLALTGMPVSPHPNLPPQAGEGAIVRCASFTFMPEVILLGTGTKQQFAHPDLYRELIRAKIAVEFMDTPAACRTYNILVAEDRKVIAAVLINP